MTTTPTMTWCEHAEYLAAQVRDGTLHLEGASRMIHNDARERGMIGLTMGNCDALMRSLLRRPGSSRTTDRPTTAQTLMEVAHVWARRATCPTRQVGAVLARRGRQLAQGYNGTAAMAPHCDHPADQPEGSCRAVHAEANVIATAARFGVSTAEATLYITDEPCNSCAGLLINAGISDVVYDRPYVSKVFGSGTEALMAAGVIVRQMVR